MQKGVSMDTIYIYFSSKIEDLVRIVSIVEESGGYDVQIKDIETKISDDKKKSFLLDITNAYKRGWIMIDYNTHAEKLHGDVLKDKKMGISLLLLELGLIYDNNIYCRIGVTNKGYEWLDNARKHPFLYSNIGEKVKALLPIALSLIVIIIYLIVQSFMK